MILPDIDYLRRIEGADAPSLLRESKFLNAQTLFFSVVESLGGSVDFEIANMREVHAIAALGTDVKNKRVLDIGCGSTEPYVLEDTFRDRYPPFFAEMLARRGAIVTGVDIRPNPTAHYDHRVLDCTKPDWMQSLDPPYDIIACLSLFNAPGSPFEHDAALCDRLMKDMRGLLAPDGLAIVTLRDGDATFSKTVEVLHMQGNCAWIQQANPKVLR